MSLSIILWYLRNLLEILHRTLCCHWLGISMLSLKGMNHQVGLDFKTADSLPGNFEAPADAIVLFEHNRLIIHTNDFLNDSPKFDLAHSPVQDWAVRKPLAYGGGLFVEIVNTESHLGLSPT